MSALGGIYEHQVERYHADYSRFDAKVHDYYSTLHERVRIMGATIAINYWIANDSGVAAQGLRIEFDLEGRGSLVADREDAAPYLGSSLIAPEPPGEPRASRDFLHNIQLQD